MLKPAQLYKEELQRKHTETWYDPRYMYYGDLGMSEIKFSDDNYNEHQFASVDAENNVIGYISYRVDWITRSANQFGIISYDIGNIIFAQDCYKAVCDLFYKYHMNRVEWFAFADSPVVNKYREFIEKHSGRECAYYRQANMLTDGKLHDTVVFEILASEFNSRLKGKLVKNGVQGV